MRKIALHGCVFLDKNTVTVASSRAARTDAVANDKAVEAACFTLLHMICHEFYTIK